MQIIPGVTASRRVFIPPNRAELVNAIGSSGFSFAAINTSLLGAVPGDVLIGMGKMNESSSLGAVLNMGGFTPIYNAHPYYLGYRIADGTETQSNLGSDNYSDKGYVGTVWKLKNADINTFQGSVSNSRYAPAVTPTYDGSLSCHVGATSLTNSCGSVVIGNLDPSLTYWTCLARSPSNYVSMWAGHIHDLPGGISTGTKDMTSVANRSMSWCISPIQ